MESGRETLSHIERALADIGEREGRLQRELDETGRQRSKLTADRLDALKELAGLRVGEAIADGVIDEADRLGEQVRTLLVARTTTIGQLRQRLATAEADRQKLVSEQDALNHKIAGLEERLDSLGTAAREALKADAGYAALAAARATLADTHKAAAAKAEAAARTESEKGAPYRADPLFMYLWQRRYGTSAYAANPLFAWLDGQVARLIGYHDARANYAILTEIPIRLQEHAEALAGRLAEADVKVDALEAARIRQLAGGDLVEELRQARAGQDALARKAEALAAELSETGNQLRLYAEGRDLSYQRSVTLYADFLEHESMRQLVEDAEATPMPTDDRVVERVVNIGREIDKLDAASEERKHELDDLFAKKQELTRITANFRRERYDDVGSVFDGIDTQELLLLLLRGAITAAEYWARTQSSQKWRSRPADPWRRSSGLPPLGDMLGGGRRSSGGSGGFRGKDFRTGGTF